MNKKAQLDMPLIAFTVLVIALIILGPIMLKIFSSIKTPMSNSLGNLSGGAGAVAQNNFNFIMDTGINFWDEVLVVCFVIAVIILFVSAFLIDAHPFFIILYILAAMFLVLFAPSIMEAADKIYDSAQFATEASQLVFMNFLRTHYGEVLVGLMIITGIIIFGKVVIFGRNK